MCGFEIAELPLRHPEKLKNRNAMKFSKEIFCIWGRTIHCQYRLGTISLNSSPPGKNLGVKITKLNMSHQNNSVILK